MNNLVYFFLFLPWATSLVPPMFQWKTIDLAFKDEIKRHKAIASKEFIPENNMPTGIARWKEKLFITIPRWKTGVPSTLNYIPLNLNCVQDCPLHPYPSWQDGYLSDSASNINSNATIVSTFRVHVDSCDRLWVVDNGVVDMANEVKQITTPAIVVYNLNDNMVEERYEIPNKVIMDSSVLTSIVVDINKDCKDAYAYITDMGSNAVIVYSLDKRDSWRVEHPFFSFDPFAGSYKVGGVQFYWNDGVSSAALSKPKKDGFRHLYLQPTSSTKQFRISTKVLRNKDVDPEKIIDAVEVVGDRGPNTQSTACDYDPCTNVLFYTQLNKNGLGCWNLEKPFNEDNAHVFISDCNLMEFPNDIKVDAEGNVWILSDRQSRFLYDTMDYNEVNFRIMSAPACMLVEDCCITETGDGSPHWFSTIHARQLGGARVYNGGVKRCDAFHLCARGLRGGNKL